jgi:hypothetical protein
LVIQIEFGDKEPGHVVRWAASLSVISCKFAPTALRTIR